MRYRVFLDRLHVMDVRFVSDIELVIDDALSRGRHVRVLEIFGGREWVNVQAAKIMADLLGDASDKPKPPASPQIDRAAFAVT